MVKNLSLNHDITTSLGLSSSPKVSKQSLSPQVVYECKGATICPSTTYKGAKIVDIYVLLMWNAVNGGSEPEP